MEKKFVFRLTKIFKIRGILIKPYLLKESRKSLSETTKKASVKLQILLASKRVLSLESGSKPQQRRLKNCRQDLSRRWTFEPFSLMEKDFLNTELSSLWAWLLMEESMCLEFIKLRVRTQSPALI